MNKLDIFVKMLSGNFDNQEQYDSLKDQDENFPYCRHVNTVCNNKIIDLDPDFKGVFLVEESYYTAKGSTHASSHLFLFTEEDGGIKLTSYEVPEGYNKNDFTYDKMKDVKLSDLKLSAKFTPAIYKEKDGGFEGGSVSMFSPVLKFTLFERFFVDRLEVSESMEVNGKRTFGYDVPIIYKRTD